MAVRGSRVARWALLPGIACALAAIAALSVEERWLRALQTRWATPSHSRHPIRGIDVSHHQGVVDWQRVKAAGNAFAYIKVSEGADFLDRRFADNWRDARAAGLELGAYHFFTFCTPGLPQAEHFLSAAPSEGATLPLAVDVEFTGNCRSFGPLPEIGRELVSFVRRVAAVRGQEPLIYTTPDVLRELIPDELLGHTYWLRDLWGRPRGDVRWDFWQYSGSGEVPGVRGAVDLDVFSGDEEAWRARFAGD